MAVNLNNTTPSPSTGMVNVQWNQDGSGNVSAAVPLGAIQKQSVAPVSGVLTLNCSLNNSFLITWNANITSIVVENATDGQEITLLWAVDATGGYTVTAPSSLVGFPTPNNTANSHSTMRFTYNSANTNWYLLSSVVSGM